MSRRCLCRHSHILAFPSSGPSGKARAIQNDYRAVRPKVERKLAHLVRRKHGGRHARVRGLAKVDADFNLLAAAANIARLGVLGLRSTPQRWALG